MKEQKTRIRIYRKLVRDRVPEIIEFNGKTCVTETLFNVPYLEMLEVMRAVVNARDWTWEQPELVPREKAGKRGGFEKKILLREVIEKRGDQDAGVSFRLRQCGRRSV